MVDALLPLRLRGVIVEARGERLIGPLDLDLEPGGFTIIMGPNGAGKTTLLRVIHGLQRPSAGTVEWATPLSQARRQQAFVAQTPVIMRRRVADNIAYPLRLRGIGRAEARRLAAKWAQRVGLDFALDRQAHSLSGGEKQKLALARALITEPQLLFLDEPTTNLDGRSIAEIESILRQASARGVRIVMVTHNQGQARRLATDVIFFYRGQLHQRQAAPAFFDAPETPEARAFLDGDILP